jgi:tetratricopeptide (TPR) repeat protein
MVLLEADRRTALAAQASLLEKLGRFSEAADALRPAVENDSDNTELAVRHAGLLIKAERLDEALGALRSLKSGDDAVLDLLSEAHRKSGRPERMIDDLRSRLAVQPGEHRFALRLADELVRIDRPDDARDVLVQFVAQQPDAHDVRLRLIDLAASRQDWTSALQECANGLVRGAAPVEAYESRIGDWADSPTALSALLDSVDINNRSAAELYLLGLLAQRADRSEQAETLLIVAVQRDPTLMRPRVILGQRYFDAYRYEDVINLAAVDEDDPVPDNAELALLLGRTHERLDQLDQAERFLRAVTQLDRANLLAMLTLADVYERSGRSNLAQRQLQVLLDREPAHEGARDRLAVMYMREGKIDAAIEQIAELRRRTDSEIIRARCQTLLDAELRRDPEARRRFLADAIEQHGGDAATWMAIAETYDDLEPEGKYEAYTKAHELDPRNEDALVGLIDAEQRLLRFEQAAERFEELLRRRPNRHTWRLALLDLYSAIGRNEEVLARAQTFDAAEHVEANHRREYRARIIKALRNMGKHDERSRLLHAWADADPEEIIWNLWLADEYIRMEQAEKAVPIYQKRYDANPGEWGALASLADALVKAGRLNRAAQFILDKLEDDPESDQATWMLSTLLADHAAEPAPGRETGTDETTKERDREKGGKPSAEAMPISEAAYELIRNQLLRTRNRETFQDFLIERYRIHHRHAEAISFVESLMDVIQRMIQPGPGGVRRAIEQAETQARMLLPNEPFTGEGLQRRYEALRAQLAVALIGDKQYRLAEQYLTEWLEAARDRNNRLRYLWRLADCQREQGDEERALESMKQALAIMPDNVSLNNDVAYSMIDKGVKLDEAERMIRLAVWRAPEQPAYLDTYGWLWYKKGRFAEAKKWLERALAQQDQPDPVILDHLGDTLWGLGDEAAAIDYWKRAVETAKQRLDRRNFEPSADEQRTLREAPSKIEAVQAGKTPPVAALARPEAPEEGDDRSGDGS